MRQNSSAHGLCKSFAVWIIFELKKCGYNSFIQKILFLLYKVSGYEFHMVFDMADGLEMAMEDTSVNRITAMSSDFSAGASFMGQEVTIRKTFPDAWIWNDYSNERLVQFYANISCYMVLTCVNVG